METMKENEIVLYQPDETVRLEARIQENSVWLTQQQIADLFGTKRPAITKHLKNIYSSGELNENSTCSILELMGNDGKQTYSIKWILLLNPILPTFIFPLHLKDTFVNELFEVVAGS